MNDWVIRAENIGKRYRIGTRQKYRMFRDEIMDRLQSFSGGWGSIFPKKKSTENVLWALKDVSFEVKQGSSVGIVGANGAGKTTLLKILSRITAPTTGRIRMRGRVGSLLEVGTGFHPELTGRDNVFLNGAILGMKRREIEQKFDEIVDFSGVEEFIDTPVKHFSSGMRMRLAFSVAAHLEPEILLIDEVLAVGDVAFQKKSLAKMEDVTHQGRTVLFVSHNMVAVKALCQSAIYMEQGQVKYIGLVDEAIQKYLGNAEQSRENNIANNNPKIATQILSIYAHSAQGNVSSSFAHDEPIFLRLVTAVNRAIYKGFVSINIYDSNFEPILTSYDFETEEFSHFNYEKGVREYQILLPGNILVPGEYMVSAEFFTLRKRGISVNYLLENACNFSIYDNGSQAGQLNLVRKGVVQPKLKWSLL